MIVIGICCWISEKTQLPELRRCLDSVKGFKVIVVDGKWYDIDSDILTSIPEAYEMFKEYPNVEVIVSINRHEWENRNLYLERCNKDDILIVLDTDEYVKGSMDGYVPDSDSFQVEGYSLDHGGKIMTNRGISCPSSTYHIDRHNELWHDGHKLDFRGRVPSNIIIVEQKDFRTEESKTKMRIRNQKKPFR